MSAAAAKGAAEVATPAAASASATKEARGVMG